MKNDPILAALAQLDDLQIHTAEGRKQFSKALASKSNLVVKKAAGIVGDAQEKEFAPQLADAFKRFLDKPAQDKGCVALTAMARALVALDYDDAAVFRSGMRHVQMEGTWGGSDDVASELRAVCAMGLANTRDPNKMRDLVELLADEQWPARAGAARAIAAVGSDAAALLLRLKILIGDRESDVISDCLVGLLDVDGAEALPLVESIANSRDEALRDAAILALGESRRGCHRIAEGALRTHSRPFGEEVHPARACKFADRIRHSAPHRSDTHRQRCNRRRRHRGNVDSSGRRARPRSD